MMEWWAYGPRAPEGRNSFPRGEAVERSETEEECGQKPKGSGLETDLVGDKCQKD